MASSESPAETIGRTRLRAAGATVAALSQAMSAGELSSAELVTFYADRIERLNPELGAVISVSADAQTQAAAADLARADGAAACWPGSRC